MGMRNWFLNCFTSRGKASKEEEEVEEEGNKHHHEQGGNVISHLPDQSNDVPADRIRGDLFALCSEREEIKNHEKLSSFVSDDRISDLPDDVLLLILSFLPSKAIGRTSVLSRRWSRVWSSYPILDFSELLSGSEAVHRQMRERIINTVLACLVESNIVFYRCHKVSLTKGSLDWFQRVRGDPENSCLARVEELVLDVSFSSSANPSTFPRCQLKSHSIRSSSRLSSKAWLGFPSTYVVSSYLLSLQDLTLKEVELSGVDLFSVSSFPFLEKLELDWCRGMTALNICCPNLKDIHVSGMKLCSMNISGMRLKTLYFSANRIHGWVDISAPNLHSLNWGNYITDECSIRNFPTPKRYLMLGSISFKATDHSFVIHLLSYSSHSEILELSHYYLEILSEIYHEFGGLPFSFGKLKTLRIHYSIGQRHLRGLACLLKSSPVVHTLKIWLFLEEDDKWNQDLLETQVQYMIPSLIRLKVVDIYLGKNISENAITFAKIMLKYGTGLQNIILQFWRSGSSLPPNALDDTVALLNGFPRASTNAKLSTDCF